MMPQTTDKIATMLSKEIVEEVFIRTPLHNENGFLWTLPPAGKLVMEVFRRNWFEGEFPEGQIPMISVGPKKLPDGTEGYSIRKEIVYKNLTSPF